MTPEPGEQSPYRPASPKQWLRFVQLDPFPPAWKRLRLGDEDLRELEIMILTDPEGAPVVAGTGGLRKLRFAPASWAVGKRGALRVCYVYFRRHGLVALVLAYEKKSQENLSSLEKRQIKGLIAEIEGYLERQSKPRGHER